MVRQEIFDCIVQYYELFFIRVSHYSNYTFTPTEKEIKSINRFIDLLSKSISLELVTESYLFDFFSYQFMTREDQNSSFGKGVVMFNWVIGPKALKNWEVRFHNWDYFLREFLKKYDINKSFYIQKSRKTLSEYEEELKSEFYQSEQGFLQCIESTRLFSEVSDYCKNCKFKLNCKEIRDGDL